MPLRPGRKSLIALLVLVALCIGWWASWHLLAGSVESGLDDWISAEQRAGRDWICGKRTIGGFPFRIEARCESPTFSGRVAGARVQGSVGDIVAAAQAYSPNSILATIRPPLRIQTTPNIGAAILGWQQLEVSYQIENGAFHLGSVDIQAADFHPQVDGLDHLDFTADDINFQAAPSANELNALGLGLKIKRLISPAIVSFLNQDSPLDLSAQASVSNVNVLTQDSSARPVEVWRRAGGRIQLASFSATIGDISLDVAGFVDLDPAHRPHGAFNVTADGLGPTFEKLGIPSALLAIGGLFGGQPTGATGARPNAIRFPIKLENGRAAIGPVQLPVSLPPLY